MIGEVAGNTGGQLESYVERRSGIAARHGVADGTASYENSAFQAATSQLSVFGPKGALFS
ncbi:MAG: hypothetical protein LBT94_01805 [Prevotellaceae bacterium]|jgi:hypothetical protein|nr:hypothetical protein [Prevotellaceae bacterium]